MTERDHRPSDAILSTLVGTLRDTALALQSVSETVKHYVDALLRTGTDPPAAPSDPGGDDTGGKPTQRWQRPDPRKVRRAECIARSFGATPTTADTQVLSTAYGEPHRPVDPFADTDDYIYEEQAIPTTDAHQLNAWRQSICDGLPARVRLEEGGGGCAGRPVIGDRLRRAKRLRDASLSAARDDDGTAPDPRRGKANGRTGVRPRYGRWKGAASDREAHEPPPAETDAAAVYDEQSIPTSDAQQLNVWRKATVESVRAPPTEGVVGQPNQKK